jgi:LysM repeat protein
VVVLAAYVVLALAGLLFGRGAVVASTGSSGPVVEQVTVQPGESLWQIAQRVAPGADPRATIERILEINGLSSGSVQAGQQLAVPAAH